jgi:hypothetical protein
MGLDAYNHIDNKSFKIEQELKICTLEKMRNDKSLLKQLGLKQIDLDNELLNNSKISHKGLLVLCTNFRLNVILVINKMYYEITGNPEALDTVSIIQFKNEQYGIYLDTSINPTDYRENYWKVLNLDKPLKGFGSYKVEELHNISNKLSISLYYDNGRKKNKKYIYEEILTKI